MINLTGKVALVTGSSRGLGRAIALKLAEAGADIVVNFAHTRSAADETAGRIADFGRRVAEVQADLTEPDDIQAMVEWIAETFGRLDIVVSNVVAAPNTSLLTATPDQFDTAMRSGVRPLLLLAQAAQQKFPPASAPSRLIAVSPVTERRGLLGAGDAVLQQTVGHLAAELSVHGVNVNAVQVGGVSSDAAHVAEGVAGAILYLASPLGDLIQGQTLVINSAPRADHVRAA
ncbi:MAG: hypothetical protein B7Z55_09940 [Planctomycetales bacterium 12-60-4]|nr:MAG: hypothetical protein B7Z55_09940 [Planctomycetales bacterium 12-60-4]